MGEDAPAVSNLGRLGQMFGSRVLAPAVLRMNRQPCQLPVRCGRVEQEGSFFTEPAFDFLSGGKFQMNPVLAEGVKLNALSKDVPKAQKRLSAIPARRVR